MSCFWEYCVSASNSFLKLTPRVTFVTSPLAVDFRGFMARQSKHIIYRQAGRLVGLQCQRGEPVHGHKWEEAGIIDWVLVPGNRDEDVKMAELSKSAGIHRGVMSGGALIGHWERSCVFACQGRQKVSHTRSVWTVICMLFTEMWETSEKK